MGPFSQTPADVTWGLAVGLVAFACAAAGTFAFRTVAIRKGIVANPNYRSLHQQPMPKGGGIVFSIAFYPRWVSLFFLKGAGLPDPEGLLQGSGSQVRHIRMTNAAMLDDPAVQALISEALDRAEPPIDPSGEQRLIVRSVAAKHRARRPR